MYICHYPHSSFILVGTYEEENPDKKNVKYACRLENKIRE